MSASIETYRLEVRERDEAEGLDVDLYDGDDLVAASTRVAYDDHGLAPAEDRDDPPSIVTEVTTDATATDLQYERDDAGFTIRVLADREEVVTERVDDEPWGLEPA